MTDHLTHTHATAIKIQLSEAASTGEHGRGCVLDVPLGAGDMRPEGSWDHARLVVAVSGLDAECRMAVELHLTGHPLSEIMVTLHLPRRRVMLLVRRGLRQLELGIRN